VLNQLDGRPLYPRLTAVNTSIAVDASWFADILRIQPLAFGPSILFIFAFLSIDLTRSADGLPPQANASAVRPA
jgi:hypothetical protein